MLEKDRAVTPAVAMGKGWELYEEETPDGKKYGRKGGVGGTSDGKPMKNVVVSSVGRVSIKIAIPREAFVDMVRQYFKIKGY